MPNLTDLLIEDAGRGRLDKVRSLIKRGYALADGINARHVCRAFQ